MKKLDMRGVGHDVMIVAFVVVFAVAGVGYLVASHANQCVVSGPVSHPVSHPTSAPASGADCEPVSGAVSGAVSSPPKEQPPSPTTPPNTETNIPPPPSPNPAPSVSLLQEAETMQSNRKAYTHSSQDASRSEYITLASSSYLSTTFTPNAKTSALTIKAKGSSCEGWPLMRVRVNGKTISSHAVKTSKWATYTSNINLKPGSHNFRFTFTNDYRIKGACDRNLMIDKVELKT